MAAWSGLWDGVHGAPHTLVFNRNSLRRKVSKIARHRGFLKTKELMLTLNGEAVGGAALATYKQIASVVGDQGGLRALQTVTVIDRNTAAADETMIDTMLTQEFAPATYPTDLSGNGGGGKVGV